MDDAFDFPILIKEINTRIKALDQIPVVTYTDSKGTMDSIHSVGQATNKHIWPVIQAIKDALDRGEVRELKYVDTTQKLADAVT